MRKLLSMMLLISFVLSACSTTEDATPIIPVSVEETITIRFAVSEVERSFYEDLARQFERVNPETQIELVTLEDILDLNADAIEWPQDAWLRIASSADVFRIRSTDLTPVQQHLLRDLSPLIESDASFRGEDFFQNALESFQFDGGTWGVPLNLNLDFIFFDKDAFDQSGRSYPQAGWTWNDFVDAAKALTVREDDSVARWGYVQSAPDPLRLIEGRVDALFDDTTPRFDQSDVIDAVRWYIDLHQQDKIAPYLDPSDEQTGERLIADRQAAMWQDSLTSWSWRSVGRHLGVVSYPMDDPTARASTLIANGLAISAGSAQPNAAWRWIDFVSRQVVSDLQTVQLLPARRSVAEVSGYWDLINVELSDALRHAIEHSYVRRNSTGDMALVKAIDAILKGEKTIEVALQEAQAEAMNLLREDQIAQAEATPVPVVVEGQGNAPVNTDAQKIIFTVSADNTLDRYRELADQFNRLHPEVVIDVRTPWSMMSGAISIETVAPDADCLQWYWGARSADPGTLAAIASLDALVEADASFDTDNFFPVLLDLFSTQGHLWGLPAEMSPLVIAYDKDIFDAAGVAYPNADWTLDDFRAMAIALTKGEGDARQYGYVGDGNEMNEMPLWLEQLGARLIDERIDPAQATFNDPATVEALRWYASLYTEYDAKPNFIYDVTESISFSDLPDRELLIRQGRAAMWSQQAGFAVSGLADRRIGVAPWPAANDGVRRAVFVAASGYFISAHSEARQACWQWLTYLTGQPDVVRGLPARRSMAQSDAYRQYVGIDRADAYLESLNGADAASLFPNSDQRPPWLGPAQFWLMQEYLKIVEEGVEVQLALDAAQDLADDYRDCLSRRDGFSDFEQQAECVRTLDPDLATYLFRTPG